LCRSIPILFYLETAKDTSHEDPCGLLSASRVKLAKYSSQRKMCQTQVVRKHEIHALYAKHFYRSDGILEIIKILLTGVISKPKNNVTDLDQTFYWMPFLILPDYSMLLTGEHQPLALTNRSFRDNMSANALELFGYAYIS
jgi:hypothetical protein